MSERRFRLAVTAAVGCIMAFAIAGCSEDSTPENALAARLPYVQYVVHDTTIGATASGSFKYVSGTNGIANLLGVWDKYSASYLVEFTPAYFPTRDTASVFDATLTLTTVTRLGDASGTLSFTAYRILQSWNEGTASSDTVTSGFYEGNISRGTYTGSGGADTQQVVIHLDTAMVREWLSSSSTANKYGIILVPSSNSTVIRGMAAYGIDSTSYIPTLKIVAGNAAGTSLDTATYNVCIDTFVGSMKNFVPDPSLLYLQAGIEERSRLNFDISFLPKGTTVNKAELRLRQNVGASVLTSTSDSLMVVHNLASATDSSLFTSLIVSIAHSTDSLHVYTGDIFNPVQAWVKGSNYGLLLRMGSVREYDSFDALTFYGPTATDPKLRPSLHIVYTVPK